MSVEWRHIISVMCGTDKVLAMHQDDTVLNKSLHCIEDSQFDNIEENRKFGRCLKLWTLTTVEQVIMRVS